MNTVIVYNLMSKTLIIIFLSFKWRALHELKFNLYCFMSQVSMICAIKNK